ncbi:MAG TPA: hypothetical protein VM261_07520 [Kofleriaceae bacterium]|nr:hypothetical protein [Kofleriaceae bacterium]
MRALAAMLVVAACGGGGKDAAVCRQEAAALGELLSTMDHELPAVYANDAKLVLRPDVPVAELAYAPQVTITGEALSFQGQQLDLASLEERLLAAHAMEREEQQLGRPGSRGRDLTLAHVVAAEDARWTDVAGTLRALHAAGYVRPAIWFARPGPAVKKPPRSKIDDELDRIQHSDDAGSKATEFARVMEKLVKGCAPLQEAFGAVAADTGESKAETIIRAIEPSLVKCNCNVDMPSFGSAMFRLLYIEQPLTAFRVTLDPAAAAPLTMPPSTPWRIAHERLTPDATIWLN